MSALGSAALIAPSALIFVLRCLPRYVGRAKVFMVLFIALFFGSAAASYSLEGPLMNASTLTINVLLGYSLFGWLYTAALPSRPEVAAPKLSLRLADVVGKVVLTILVILAATYLVSMVIMVGGRHLHTGGGQGSHPR